MKRTFIVPLASALVAFGGVLPAAAEDVAVIVNKSNPINALTMTQLRKIVLAQEAKWASGGKIVVWMTPAGQPERVGLLKIVTSMSETDISAPFLSRAHER